MTAEIAVMNRGAIALAADSKVTVTTGGVTKTYDTVSKLFTLSKVAPVGIMIYGNADFMGFPWETIIKLYRRKKADKTEAKIVDWAADFFRFVENFGVISKENQDENVESILLSTLFELVSGYEDWAHSHDISHDAPEFETGLRAIIQRKANKAATAPPWAGKRQMTSLVKRYSGTILKVIHQQLGDYSEETKKEAVPLLVATLVLAVGSPQTSGVVIAGFGDDEYFPTLVEYQTDGYVGGKVKYYLFGPVVDVSRKSKSCIRAFAQREMVQRFMDGIDPSYSLYLSQAIPELVVDNCLETLDRYGIRKNKTEEIKAKIRDAVNQAVDKFESDAQSYRSERFSDPVVRMVSVLPKDELAHLAESLVALTSLKRRVSSDAETVGGPVDVALISKGDGFIWIKRKHYFRDDLNPQFVRNYMHDISNGGSHAEPDRANGSRRAPAQRSPSRRGRAGKTREPEAKASG